MKDDPYIQELDRQMAQFEWQLMVLVAVAIAVVCFAWGYLI